MNYREMIEKALKGRSVNSMAKAWGIPQPTLDRYVKGDRMPDYNTGLKIAKEAGVDAAEAFEVFAAEERVHKVKNFKLQMGFAREGLLAAIAAVATVVTLFLTPAKAEASSHIAYPNAEIANNLYYVKYGVFVSYCGQ